MTGDEREDAALVAVVAVPNLVEAERVAARLRRAGIPAILDPQALQELHAGSYRDVHLAFPVLVPRHYEADAVSHLEDTLHRPEGSEDPETVLAAWDADEEPLPERGWQWSGRLMVLFFVLAAAAFLLYALLPGNG